MAISLASMEGLLDHNQEWNSLIARYVSSATWYPWKVQFYYVLLPNWQPLLEVTGRIVNAALLWLSSGINVKSFVLFILRFWSGDSAAATSTAVSSQGALFFPPDISLSSKIIAVAVGHVWLLLVRQGLHHTSYA
jgi:hypothetical protein